MSKIYFILGPSGVGKGTSIDILKKRHPEWFFPISVTTRSIRSGEKEGVVYNFVSREEFEKMIKQEKLLEFAKVHDLNFYGTLKEPIMNKIKEGRTVIREIDIQGFLQARERISKENLVSIFLHNPDLSLLEKRIKKRSKLSPTEIEQRLQSARQEIAQMGQCDFIIESKASDPIDFMASEIEKIVQKSEKLQKNT